MINGDILKMFTHSELISIVEFMDNAINIKDKKELVVAVKNLKHLIPYEYAICNVSHIHKSGIIPMDVTNISYPSEFLEFYFENGLESVDPLVQYHYQTFQLQVWSETFSQVGKISDKLVNVALEFNMQEGLTFGSPDPELGVGTFFCLSGAYLKPKRRHVELFRKIVPHLHQAYLRLLPDEVKELKPAPNTPKLTKRELEILNLVKDGMTNWKISEKLIISQNTVKFHLTNIMRKLGIRSRAHAIAKAMDMGIIRF